MDDTGLTLRELVLEIRGDVKTLGARIDHIDRKGSIGTRDELNDHERRLRGLEAWRYAIPPSFVIAVASVALAIAR